jgi:aspartyl/asparaginyl beta-hydroxylase (cupin superfamily)
MHRIEVLRRWAQNAKIPVADLNRLTSALEAGGFTLPGLDVQPFYEIADFPWTADAHAQARTLGAELDRLAGRLASHPETDVLVTLGYWRVFFLWRGGRERPDDSRTAPAGRAVTGFAPGGGQAGNSYYSVLGPGTVIKAHTGLFNARLRCHVGLHVPEGAWIEVGGERREWRVGKCLIFSDALPHHVTNAGCEARSVFAFDFWHPDVTAIERSALSMLLSVRQ